ncbi:TonB-dependent receptor [Rheinheimera riviphila]|uniref:TonB-dependent receptor n=1 Tax=Rheinheimera riviphila TaxID=1834037 RepID=A0A437QBY1_9GAMM|nr:TonB-dependent receptor [Rheinheimera riviphila]RVU32031.1 TonB-dependent receptor [Rheinheimera riviphila]
MKMRHIAMAVAVALSSSYAMADTSSAVRGRISNPEGAPAAGTKVTILHVPSGTSRTVTTNEGGSFVAAGLRVGGPYKIIVDSETYADETVEDVYLQLGDTFQLNKQLQAENVERIAVTGAVVASGGTNGSSSYFGADDIKNAPSFNNDLKDIVKNNPMAVLSPKDGELTVAGNNPRYNSISIDGIAQNDTFGLNANGYPTTRSPISFDAIDQITVDVAPFNAKAGGFQGGQINAVTKSGANEMFGSVKYEIKNDSLAGTPENRFASTVKQPLTFDNKLFGATLGGAVVQDKLFYFISAEQYDATPPLEWGPTIPNGTNPLANASLVTQEQINQVVNIAKTVYGVEAGDWNVIPEETDEKLLLKLDWNISDEQRASYTYQYNKGNQTQGNNSTTAIMRLSSNWYNKEEVLNNHAFQLYSDWTSDFSTKLSATYMDVATLQKSLSDFGDVSVLVPRYNGNPGQTATIALGSDISRHSNDLKKKTWILGAEGDYLLDNHRINFGYQFTRFDVFNLFLQRTKGQYTFNGIANFQNQIAQSVRYQNAISHDANDAAASFARDEHALYVNDEWAATDDLTVNYGLRYERLTSGDVPAFNAFSLARTGYNNTENLDGVDIFLPRAGFKYIATDDLTLRGGVGRFSGGQPTVWISNSYSNVGIGTGDRSLSNLTGVKITEVPQALKNAVAGVTTGGNTNLVDPNFELPSDWRFQLAADYVFSLPVIGDDINWTTELMYVRKQDSAQWRDVSILDSEQVATTPDGLRKIYRDTDGVVDIMLTNAEDDGRSKIFSTMLSKNWESGFNVTTSYTNQDITEGAPATSSTAGSNYGNNPVINRNESIVGRSTFETEHRFVVNFGYETELFSGYATNVNLWFERRSGKPINYLLGIQDFNGTNPLTNPSLQLSPGTSNNYYLPFIPKQGDKSVVKFANATAETAFFERIKQLGLDKYEGQYLPKGVSTTPWVTTLDMSVRQEVPGFAEGHKGTIYFNVENLLNLIDHSKGKVYGDDFGDVTLADFTLDQATNQYIYNNITSNQRNWDKFYPEKSTWRIKLGVSYNF